MPWFAQLRSDGHAYIAICETPWNAGYDIDHPAGGPYTHVGMWFEPSLGRMDYRRVVRYRLLDHADHTAVCKTYRAYVNERGRLRTLAEKAARNPSVRDLLGRSWVHVGIKTKVQPDSSFYDPRTRQEYSPRHVAQRERQMRTLHEIGCRAAVPASGRLGAARLRQRPSRLSAACREAGGWKGMKSLVDACHEQGDLFGTHDQYRDYYFAARTFDPRNAIRLADGTMPEHAMWAGGRQTYLCAELCAGLRAPQLQ